MVGRALGPPIGADEVKWNDRNGRHADGLVMMRVGRNWTGRFVGDGDRIFLAGR